MTTCTISKTVTTSKHAGNWIVYNWQNAECVVLSETGHPFYKGLELGNVNPVSVSDFPEDDLSYLIENGFLISGIGKQAQAHVEDSKSRDLHLILLPAGQACNFACTYCYEEHQTKTTMGTAHEEAVMAMINNRKPEQISIEYFGGEPLLNSSFIRSLNKKMQNYAQATGGFFSSSITTNGYLLTPLMFNELYNSGLHVLQITLDGLAEDHNVLRPLISGRPTHERILQNLCAVSTDNKNIDVRFIIRINFNETSASPDKRLQVLKKMKECFGSDDRFSFRFRPISDYASMNGKSLTDTAYCAKMASGSLKDTYENEAMAAGLPLADISMLTGYGAHACYAGKEDSFVIHPDFSINKCTVAFDNPLNNVGKLDNNGNIHLNKNWALWVKQNKNSEEKCGTCFFVNQCTGAACPLYNINQNKKVCPDIKGNFMHQIDLLLGNMIPHGE